MTRDEAEGLYVALCDQWPHLPVAGEAEAWVRFLLGQSASVAGAALKMISERATTGSMPSIGDFADACRQVRENPQHRPVGYGETGIEMIEQIREEQGWSS